MADRDQAELQRSSSHLWGGAFLITLLAVLRAIVVFPELNDLSTGAALLAYAGAVAEDVAMVLVLVFLIEMALRSVPRQGHALIFGVFYVAAIVIAAFGLSNVMAQHMLGAPLTMDWVRYSDIGHTDVILASLFKVLPWPNLLAAVALLVALFAVSRWASKHSQWGYVPKLMITLAAAVMLFGFAFGNAARALSAGQKQNAVLAFATSVFADGGEGAITRLAGQDVDFSDRSWPFDRIVGLTKPAQPPVPIRNVLLFAYESTPAKQAQGWGGTEPVTPNLLASLDHGLAFDRAYAHVPASNYFLVSAFGSLIPELSSISMTYTRPEFDFNALPEVLSDAGMRTGFFNSSDNRFQNTEVFVTAAGFETVRDYRDWTCETGVYEYTSVSEQFLNTSSDLCTADKITDWLDEDRETPFFVAFRTGMTHYPYFPGEDPIDYGVENETYNDYLNALRVGDAAFGRLLDYLDETGLAEETLVVVLGDHGEAFGEHGTYVHAAGINEENVHIPLALINPQLFEGARTDLIIGLKDLAPTILDLLELEAPESWQGVSAFAPVRNNGVMVFAPWNGFLVGYREGNEKLIFNANSGELQLFDLQADPEERVNLALTNPEAAAVAQQKVVSMISTQRAYTTALLAGDPLPERTNSMVDQVSISASGTYFGAPPEVWVKLDGQDVGGFTVSSAVSNEARAATQEEIDAGVKTFVLALAEPVSCAKQLEIWFLNDNWAGEDKTGDTDLWVQSVKIGGITYHNTSFNEMKEGVGHMSDGYYQFSRRGGATIDLYLDESCLTSAVNVSAGATVEANRE